MIVNRIKTIPLLVLVTVALATLAAGAAVARAEAPVKEVLSTHYGWEVDKTTKGNVCTVASGNECQPGVENRSEPGGFQNPRDVAVGSAESGENIWIDDGPNQRIQEITPAGKFVLMIGGDVNATTGANICTQAEIETAHVRCQAGGPGTGTGELDDPSSIAVDREMHDVYIGEGRYTENETSLNSARVQEFTETGQFVAMFGKEVDETKDGVPGATAEEKDICTATSGDLCKAGVVAPQGGAGTEPWEFGDASYMAFGGPEHLLYVADGQRVQEFEPEGKFTRQILLQTGNPQCATETCQLRSLAVDKAGDLYVVYVVNGEEPTAVHELGPNGEQIAEFTLSPRDPAEPVWITGAAVDDAGMLAVTEGERAAGGGSAVSVFGSLVDVASGEPITEFSVPISNEGELAFNAHDELYLAISSQDDEVVGYRPVNVAELDTASASCAVGSEGAEADATFRCTLDGKVNPEAVADTEAWFQWGFTAALGEVTSAQSVCTSTCGETPVPVNATVEGVPPNETVSYREAGFDEVVKPPEAPLSSRPIATVSTKLVAPRFVGASAEFVKRSSAVLLGQLNPENAPTRYWFQYAPAAACEHLEGCAGALATPAEESSAYVRIGASAEVTGLQPDTAYRYRMIAESENAAKTERATARGEGEQEGVFTTVAPIAVAASTGGAGGVGITTATISGSVEPDGEPVSYAFELGVYRGVATQYGVVSSGSAPASGTPAQETLALSGLRPGTTYAYRISVRYGDGLTAGWSATGTPATFTTQGLPAVLTSMTSLALLPVPSIAFPTPPTGTVKKTKRKTKHRASKRHTSRGKRTRHGSRQQAGRGSRREDN